MTDDYRVQLDVFSGPLDLLLYLIRRDELDIQDIPLARLTEQYLEYVRLLEQIDPNTAGDFLVMASTLVELKSRALLPTPPLEAEDDDDPRTMLVKQLLEYKRFKDAAEALGTSADDRAKRYVRVPADLPKDLQGVELEEAQVWDLLAAFGHVMSSIGQGPGIHQVTYDDTPIEEYKMYLLDKLERRGTMQFRALFDEYSTKSEIVGMFLAILELVRGRRVRAEQDAVHGEIYLFRIEEVTPVEEESETESPAVGFEPAPEGGPAVAADAPAEASGDLATFDDAEQSELGEDAVLEEDEPEFAEPADTDADEVDTEPTIFDKWENEDEQTERTPERDGN